MDPERFQESAAADRLRRIYRAYRNQPMCLGHGLVKRVFAAMVGRYQRVTLANGLRMELDLDRIVQNTVFWLDGDVEPPLEWLLREMLPPGGTVVDCGANCGFIGLLARCSRAARVVFVEPHPRLASTIRRNVELNGWSGDCEVVQAAASDCSGEVVLHTSAKFDGSHSLLPNWVEDDRADGCEIRVASRTLRSILEERPGFRPVDLLKVDTEGHDLAVLRGLGDALSPDRITMIYAELGRDRDEAFGRLESAGYEGFAARTLRRSALNRLRRRSLEGVPTTFFTTWTPDRPPSAETLWVPRGGPLGRFLRQREAGDQGWNLQD
ncbi:MAG: FkbM family methyltransferase [Verrucomicrobiales bacterium]|nr:FkbM family methyltransferase [Verrucomicrobiales bacterium]